MNLIEFYFEDNGIASVKSSVVPPLDSLISIRKKTYSIENITYALDHADHPAKTALRVCIDLQITK